MTNRPKHQHNKRQEAKKTLLSIYPSATNIQLMKSGNYSAVYSFQDNQKRLIFKMATDYFPIESEHYFLKQAYSKKLTPKIHKVNSKQNWLVMDFILGENTWENFSEIKNMPLWIELGKRAKTLHLIKVNGAGIYKSEKFTNQKTANFINDQIKWLFSFKPFTLKLNLTSSSKNILKTSTKLFNSSNSLLHGDLSLNNCIRRDNTITSFIDPGPWRGGDPCLDLGHIHSQALKYSSSTNKILNLFKKGYKSNLDWNSPKMTFCSVFWDLVVLRFLSEKDKTEFTKRLNQQQKSINDRFEKLNIY